MNTGLGTGKELRSKTTLHEKLIMNEILQIKEKYKGKDFIELFYSDIKKMLEWVQGAPVPALMQWNEEYAKNLRNLLDVHDGFVQFIEKGIIINKKSAPGDLLNYYPFEFTDEGLVISVIVSDPFTNQLKTAGKALISISKKPEVFLEVDWKEFHSSTYDIHYAGVVSSLEKMEYLRTITCMQAMIVLAVNAYLVLHEKQILISKIEQKRTFSPSKNPHKKRPTNPLYTYVATVPENYVPRKFDVNYIVSEWNRSGYSSARWVLVENAEAIAQRCNGKILWDTQQNGKVKVRRIISPQTVHRRAKTFKQPVTESKIYSA
jgi:hypothetical protein